jgi:hypothetical protein
VHAGPQLPSPREEAPPVPRLKRYHHE